MKKLILLLLLIPLVGVGQNIEIAKPDSNGIIHIKLCPHGADWNHPGCDADTFAWYYYNKYNEMGGLTEYAEKKFEIQLLISYSQYEKECYNDSTLKYIDPNPLYNNVFIGNPALIKLPIERYVHKTPSLKGYVQWIRRKYE